VHKSADFPSFNLILYFRYKFLAFDFDETVDVTKDNSRLLLVRLKLEGWVIGKSKVFLKYYNEEYLAR
jgi:myosin-3